MAILRNIALAVVSAALAYFSVPIFGTVYDLVLGIPMTLGIASFISDPQIENFFVGITPAYIFFVTLLFAVFGVGRKYWWAGTLLLPAVAFVLYFDLSHFWFYILVGLVGWAVGLGIAKLISLIRVSNSSRV